MSKFKFKIDLDTAVIIEYTKTIFFTMLIVLVVVCALSFSTKAQIFHKKEKDMKENTQLTYYLTNLLIDKNKFLEREYPYNYRINYKLAILYEIKGDYETSEEEYKKSISKAPYDEYYPVFRLARLYAKTNRLQDSEAFINSIVDKSDKKLFDYKAQIYKLLADKYYENAEYKNAIERYERAKNYYKLNRSKKADTIVNDIISAKVYLAEDLIKELQTNEAIDLLQEALAVKKIPILQYQLAILLTQTEPELAENHFDEVFKKAPELMNFQVYSDFLNTLSDKKFEEGDTAKGKLYKFRAERALNFAANNMLYIDDIEIMDFAYKVNHRKLRNQYDISINMRIKNLTTENIPRLNIEIDLADIDYNAQNTVTLVKKDEPLEPSTLTEEGIFNFTEKITPANKNTKSLKATVYAYKNQKYKIKIGEIEVHK